MTSAGSAKRSPELELAALVHGLKHRGLVVGVDDALRIERLFRHAGDWSHQRRVRALKMLLGRSADERQVLDQLAPFLFLNAEKRTDRVASASTAAPSEGTDSGKPSETFEHPSPKTGEARQQDKDSNEWRRRRWWVIAGFLVVLGVLGTRWLESPQQPIVDPPPPQPHLPPLMSEEPPPAVTPSPSPAPAPLNEAATNKEEIEVGTPPPPPRWPFALLLGVAAVPVYWVGLRWRRAGRQTRNVQNVAASVGNRSYRLELPSKLSFEPFREKDAQAIREAAFQLSAPVAEMPASWLDVGRTVDATARNGGRLTLRWDKWREQRAVLFIEDVSPSMGRWPGFAHQLASSISRQGGEVERYFMNGTPEILARDSDLRRQLTLEQVLAEWPEAVVVIVSDATALDHRGTRAQARWPGLLGLTTWLHPASVETWGPGACWLAQYLRVVPMNDEGLLRLGSPLQVGNAELGAAWRPALPLGGTVEARVSSLRAALGDAAFWWFASGAVLDRTGALTAKIWWALRAEDIVPAPRKLLDRVWTLDEIHVGTDGTVRLDAELREAALSMFRRERPELLSKVVRWAETLVLADTKSLERQSIAAIEARALLARLLLVDPGQRPKARRQLKQLADDGFGEWAVSTTVAETTSRGRLRLARTRRPTPVTFAGAALGAIAMGLAVVFLALPDWRERIFPAQPDFRVLGTASITPERPLRFYDYYQLRDEIWLQVGQRRQKGRRVPGSPTVWTLDWNAEVLANEPKSGTIKVRLGYELPLPEESWVVGLHDVVGVTLAAPEETDVSGRVSLSWSVDGEDETPIPEVWTVLRDGVSLTRVTDLAYNDQPQVGAAWEYSVVAEGPEGRFYRSNPVSVKLPPVKVVLSGPKTVDAEGSLELMWEPAEETAPRPNEWQLIRNGEEVGAIVPFQRTTALRWQDRPPGQGPWEYRVAAVDQEGRSYLSNSVSVAPFAEVPEPSVQLVLSAPNELDTAGEVMLTWSAVGETGSQSGEWQVIRDGEAIQRTKELQWQDRPPGLGPWAYQVAEIDAGDRSHVSNTVNVTRASERNVVRADLPEEICSSKEPERSPDGSLLDAVAKWDGVQLHIGPSLSSDVVGVASFGAAFRVFNERGRFLCLVDLLGDGRPVGWASRSDFLIRRNALRSAETGVYLKMFLRRDGSSEEAKEAAIWRHPERRDKPRVLGYATELHYVFDVFEVSTGEDFYLVGRGEEWNIDNTSQILQGWISSDFGILWPHRLGVQYRADLASAARVYRNRADLEAVHCHGRDREWISSSEGDPEWPYDRERFLLLDEAPGVGCLERRHILHIAGCFANAGVGSEHRSLSGNAGLDPPASAWYPLVCTDGYAVLEDQDRQELFEKRIRVSYTDVVRLTVALRDLLADTSSETNLMRAMMTSLQAATGDTPRDNATPDDFLQRTLGVKVKSQLLRIPFDELAGIVATSRVSRDQLQRELDRSVALLDAVFREEEVVLGSDGTVNLVYDDDRVRRRKWFKTLADDSRIAWIPVDYLP